MELKNTSRRNLLAEGSVLIWDLVVLTVGSNLLRKKNKRP